jgi:hypothetical protein
MESIHCTHLLFPYLTLSDRDLRHLALLTPGTGLLQVLGPPALPAWAAPHFGALPAGLSLEEKEQITRALGSYREFAAVHQDHCLTASFSAETLSRESSESRFDIQTQLRGKGDQDPDPETRKLLEAAVFLEMARELDQREIDLESDLAQAAHLETEFREILGIGDEDSQDDAMETLTPPLTASRAHLSFMLPRRMTSWLRLSGRTLPAGRLPTLVTVSQEVIDEIVERVEASHRQRASKPALIQVPLASIPCLPRLSSDEYSSGLSTIVQTEEMRSFRNELLSLLSDPGNADRQKSTILHAENLRAIVESSFGPAAIECSTLQLTLTWFDGLSLADLQRAIDPGVGAAAENSGSLPAPPLLCLEEQSSTHGPFFEEN